MLLINWFFLENDGLYSRLNFFPVTLQNNVTSDLKKLNTTN